MKRFWVNTDCFNHSLSRKLSHFLNRKLFKMFDRVSDMEKTVEDLVRKLNKQHR